MYHLPKLHNCSATCLKITKAAQYLMYKWSECFAIEINFVERHCYFVLSDFLECAKNSRKEMRNSHQEFHYLIQIHVNAEACAHCTQLTVDEKDLAYLGQISKDIDEHDHTSG